MQFLLEMKDLYCIRSFTRWRGGGLNHLYDIPTLESWKFQFHDFLNVRRQKLAEFGICATVVDDGSEDMGIDEQNEDGPEFCLQEGVPKISALWFN